MNIGRSVRSRAAGVVAAAWFLTGVASGEIIDIAALRDSGQCTVTAYQTDIGSPAALFDRNWDTVARSPNVSPVTVTLEFTAPRAVGASRVRFNAGDTYTWRLEAADTLADLNGQTGTYTNVFGPLTVIASPSFEWTEFNDTPVTRRVYRFTFDRLTRDDFVHVYELELQSPEPTTTVVIGGQPRRINQITVTPSAGRVVVGETQQYAASATLSYGPTTYDVTSLSTWTTDSGAVATINSGGLLTGAGPGTTAVNADIGVVHGETSVQVRSPRPIDLCVGYIHRSPEFERFRVDFDADQRIQTGYENAQMWPSPGQPVTYTAAVFNKGDVAAPGAVYRWYFDGALVQQGNLAPLAARSRANVALTLPWPADEVQTVSIAPGEQVLLPRQLERAIGGHRIRFEIDPGGRIAEGCELNNAIEDHIGAMAFRFFMDQGTYDRFNNTPNFLESYSAEDWARMQIRGVQRRLAISGVQQKLRLAELIVVPDGGLDPGGTHEPLPSQSWTPLNGTPRTGYDLLADSRWGFIWPQDYIDLYVKRIENALVHELGHQLGLIDIYNYDIATQNCLIRHPTTNALVAGTSLMQLVSPWNVWYGNMRVFHTGTGVNAWTDYSTRAAMASPGERYFEALHIAGMNRNFGLRRGFYGDFLLALPQGQYKVRLRTQAGAPVAGAAIRIFQRNLAGIVPQNPKFSGTTDAAGEFAIPATTLASWEGGAIGVDNPWSYVDGDGDYHRGPDPVGGNAPLVVEASFGGNVEYHFVEADAPAVALMTGQVGQNDPYTFNLTTYASRRPNTLPTISFGAAGNDVFLTEGQTFTAAISATDANGDPVTLTMTPLDNAEYVPLTISAGTLTFRPDSLNVNRVTPAGGSPQSELMSVIFRANDGKFTATRRMTFHVSDVPGVATLRDIEPGPCGADFNGSGGASVQDIYDFLTAWSAMTDQRADFNADGVVSVQDIYDFLSAWSAGCGQEE